MSAYPHIEKTPGVCGGKACISGIRVRVLDIVGLRWRGFEPEEMLRMYAVPLTLAPRGARLLLRPSGRDRGFDPGGSQARGPCPP